MRPADVLSLLDDLAAREERATIAAWAVWLTIGAMCVLAAHGLYCVAVCG